MRRVTVKSDVEGCGNMSGEIVYTAPEDCAMGAIHEVELSNGEVVWLYENDLIEA